ncbi:MAG: hypothetical protein HZB51_23730 [Chloroflexi bacterium]|nr:hypothetical protein [Chloroflexota bacterium]
MHAKNKPYLTLRILFGLSMNLALTRRPIRFKSICLLGACLLIALTGCDQTKGNGLSHTAYHALDELTLKVESNRSQAHVGEPVLIRFTVTNTGQKPDTVESADQPVMDIIVRVVGGETLLTWSEQNPDKVSHHLEWQPGESKVIELTWTPKEGDVYIGATHNIFLTGLLYWGPGRSQSAGVTICASSICRGALLHGLGLVVGQIIPKVHD